MPRYKIHIVGVVPTCVLPSQENLALHPANAETICDLTASAQRALCCATMIVGSLRQLELVKPILEDARCQKNQTSVIDNLDDAKQAKSRAAPRLLELPKLSELEPLIESAQAKQEHIVVLASGDPLYYGIGAWFIRNLGKERLVFHPASSSIQMACQRLGLSQQDIDVVSLHGRSLEKIRNKLKKSKRLLVLTDSASSPQFLAQECIDAGLGESQLTVLERLGYAEEKVSHFLANDLINDSANDLVHVREREFDALHLTLIEVQGRGGWLPEFPGIADDLFATGALPGKGMISKREVRLCILAYLQISDADVVWDIGAGCGGVSIEIAFWNEKAQIYAIECHQERLKYLAQNCHKFGVSANVHIVPGRAPQSCESLIKPNKVFIGGSDGNLEQLLETAWRVLPHNGVLVVSAVLERSKRILDAFSKNLEHSQTQAIELLVKRGEPVKPVAVDNINFKAKLPVQIFKFIKDDVAL